MGAWIEMLSITRKQKSLYVAPFMGAWIEISLESLEKEWELVAPFMGAWIEIPQFIYYLSCNLRRTLYGCVD